MSESKAGTAKSSGTSSTIKLSYSNSGNHSNANNLSMNNQVTSSASKNDITLEHNKRSKKKANRDRQPANDDKPAPVMSNLSYSLIDDDHIDDQETINVGNLIIDLESSLEKEKIENEQANNNVGTENKSSTDSTNARSPTSLSTESDASGSSFTYRQRSARRRAQPRSPTSMSPCSSSPINSTPSSPSSSNKPIHVANNNNTDIKSQNESSGAKPCGKIVTKNASKLSKDSSNINLTTNASSTSSNNGHTTTRTVFKSSSDERGELKMKITREKKTMKSEHKIVTSPTHKSPTGCSSSNSGNHNTDDSSNRAISQEDLTKSSSSISSTKDCGTSTSIGTITEPECLGPCEPGTSVTLEGIVWQETDGGILVVNVTWRGKTYVGALLDCTRHDWAPPRLCDSPASDIDLKANKGVRAKRIVTRSNGIGLDEKNLLQTTGKLRNGKGRRILPVNESTSCNKKQRESSEKMSSDNPSAQNENNASVSMNTNKETDNISMEVVDTSLTTHEPTESANTQPEKAGPDSPMLIGCNEPNCSKKYRNLNGLQYHQSHAHSADSNPSNVNEDCSSPTEDKNPHTAIDELPTNNLSSPNESNQGQIDGHERDYPRLQQGQKRDRTSSPEIPAKHDNRPNNDAMMQPSLNETRLSRNDSPRISYVKGMDPERRHSSSSSHSNVPRVSDPSRGSPNIHQKHQSFDSPQGHKSSIIPCNQQMSSASSLSTLPASKSSSSSKQSMQQQPPLPATTEEGMKPSGTSTGPPPAPHQANCYFNPAFLANTFNPYSMPPYFPRHLYDQITPPAIPTSNAAFLTRFMNNMRVPPPPDSPSRLLSPSLPKNVPFPPFKIDPSSMPPQIPNSIPNMSPMSNPPMPPGPLPPMPPLSLAGGPPSLRMPSQGDPILPPSSQTPFLPPAGLNPVLGLPGMGNPLGPMGGPPVPNPVDDQLAKQFPRRFN